eukprot:TRINITY_DN16573_c0_g1_i1.p1 TRINITY_DN16573_c0_g1~~TRINITY_DN16573_c0_g1_i1.p1  ORF type:complete len:842 (+),score=222.90 TRINITY_DN16573_c0_g1_i1:39-2564(+)
MDANACAWQIEQAIRSCDIAKLEKVLKEGRHYIDQRDVLVLEAEETLQTWSRRCGIVRRLLLEAVDNRSDLTALVSKITDAESHPHARLMRTDIRQAKNLVVETKKAMQAAKPALDSQNPEVIRSFLQQFGSVLPEDVLEEVREIMDTCLRGRQRSQSPTSVRTEPSHSSARRIEGTFEGTLQEHNSISRVRGRIDGVFDSSVVDSTPTPVPAPLPTPTPARSYSPGFRRTPLPPTTPDSEYIPLSARYSPSPYPPPSQQRPPVGGSGWRSQSSTLHNNRNNIITPVAATATPPTPYTNNRRSHVVDSSVDRNVHNIRVPAPQLRLLTPDNAFQTACIRLGLHEVNGRDQIMSDERRNCQFILKEMVIHLNLCRTSKRHHTRSMTPVVHVTQPKGFPEDEFLFEKKIADQELKEDNWRKRLLTTGIAHLEEEAKGVITTIAQYEADAWSNLVRIIQLNYSQVTFVLKARDDLTQFEGEARKDVARDERRAREDLASAEKFDFEHKQSTDRLTQLQREDSRVKGIEAKLQEAAILRLRDSVEPALRDIPKIKQSLEDVQQTVMRLETMGSASPARDTIPDEQVQIQASQIEELNSKLDTLSKESRAKSDLAANLQQKLADATAIENEKRAELESMKQQVDLLKAEASERTAALQESDNLKKDAQIAKEELLTLRNEVETLRREITESASALKTAETNAKQQLLTLEEEKNSELTSAQQTIAALRDEVTQKELALQSAEARLEEAKTAMEQRMNSFMSSAVELLQDEAVGRYSMWEDELLTRNRRNNSIRHTSEILHTFLVEEPQQRDFTQKDLLEEADQIDQSEEVMQLFASLCPDDDSESE